MTKIVCLEGTHGSGKGTLIKALLEELQANYSGSYAVIRDSEYPEFERVKNDIRTGVLYDKREIISVVADTRALIYSKHINPKLSCLDIAILDRSYYTSAVWQSDSIEEVYEIMAENERRNIPVADLTFILFASAEVIMERLKSRGRQDLSEHNITGILRDQDKYLHLAKNRDECVAFETNGEPNQLAKELYRLILANNAL
jgi:thymidylate kinase